MRWCKPVISFLFLFLFINFSKSQVSFDLKIDNKKIGKSDLLQAEYSVSNAGNVANFTAPVFSGWNIVGGPEYSQQSISINGQVSGSTSYIYTLAPRKTGMLVVPGATIEADGKKLSCTGVAVTVDVKAHVANIQHQAPIQLPQLFDESSLNSFEQNNILKQGEDPVKKIRKNIFVKVSASKTSCYVGEPILVSYQLFAALEDNARVNRQPAFSGCSVIEMTNPDEGSTVQKIEGKNYRVSTIRKVQLVPLQEGELKLDSMAVDNNITFSSPGNPYQTQAYSATFASNQLSITVKPLPEENKPDNFSGAIGNFQISANADSASFAEGENNILNIKIEGQGNFNGITQPSIKWNKDLQHFEGTDSQHIDKTSFPSSGEIIFQIPFIASKKGHNTIPEISFSFFDPETQSYQTVHSEKIPLLITRAMPKSEKLIRAFSEGNSNENYLWLVGLIAVIVAAVFIFSGRKKKIMPAKKDISEQKPKEKIPEPVLERQLSFSAQLESLQDETDSRAFFIKARNILRTILQQKTKFASNSVSALLSALPKFTDDEALIAEAENIYKICNYSLYTPDISEEEKILLQARLELLIKKLEV